MVDKSDIALWSGLLGAASGLLSAVFTGRIVLNDSKRMRRRPPSLELDHAQDSTKFPGWKSCTIVVCNHERVGLRLLAIEAVSKGAYVVSQADASSDEFGSFGEQIFKQSIPEMRRTRLASKVGPAGETRSASGFQRGDTVYEHLFTKGVSRSSDIRLVWEWADGQKK
ncbi:hypothetical protein [Pseudooceanicola nanhaiensis]|uniref:hypothetical protein n=1 Tax=Pseudooceanicola nanhaiensis TaxID=375761 RepID=UPI00351712C1